MAKWVILIGGPGFGLDALKAMDFPGSTGFRDYGEKQFDVLFEDGCVYFLGDFDGLIRGDYPPETLAALPFEEPQFVLMQYSAQALLEWIVSAEDFPRDVLIDCDGVDLGLERFVGSARLLDC